MKILALSPGYLPVPSGAEMSLHESLKYLAGNGDLVTALTLSDNPALTKYFPGRADHEIKDGVRIIRLKSENFLQEVSAYEADVIIVQMLQRFIDLGVNSLDNFLNKGTKPWVYMQRAEPKTEYPAAEYTIVNSQWSAEVYTTFHRADKNKVFVLKPPVSRPAGPVSAVNSREYITIVNPNIRKGGECFKYLARMFRSYKFLAQLGWAYPVEGLEELKNVEINPPTENIGEAYARTKILLVPSIAEPFGRVALEGAFAGCVVIASYLEGLKEVPLPEECFVRESQLYLWHKKLNWFLTLKPDQLQEIQEITLEKVSGYQTDLYGFRQFLAGILKD
jgi:hypothetical protein